MAHRETEPEFARRQLERLIFFSDGVFAIAITLLVLDIRLPEGSHGVIDFVLLAPKLKAFAYSFAVIGLYWFIHRGIFAVAVRDDAWVRLLNMLLLAAVVFLPFPTSVLSEFPATGNPVALYAGAVAAVGFVSTALAMAVNRPRLLSEAARIEPAGVFLARALSTPLVFAASVPIALHDPHAGLKFWWLAIPSAMLSGRATRAMRARHAAQAAPPEHG